MKKLLALIVICLTSTLALAQSGHGGSRGRPSGGRGGDHSSHGNPTRHGSGHIGHPAHFNPGPMPRGGWRGHSRYWDGHNYFVWGWAPYAPFYSWPHYYGWRLGLGYYIPEGLKCFATNDQVDGIWPGQEQYYSSDDAINSALGSCENDHRIMDAHAEGFCKIESCVRW